MALCKILWYLAKLGLYDIIYIMQWFSFVQFQVNEEDFCFGPKQNTKVTLDHPPKIVKDVSGKLEA